MFIPPKIQLWFSAIKQLWMLTDNNLGCILAIMNTHIQRAIRIVGSQSALATACGVTQAAVSKWLRGGQVPAERCIQIEGATHGEVRCEDLRPDIDWGVLRGHGPAALSAGEAAA
jgi:DNA-binding transcriptional regulator YdaS (Cro superfamily)